MITFAGTPLVLDSKDEALGRYLETVGHSAIPEAARLDKFRTEWPSPVRLNSPNWPEVGLNQLFWPMGFDRPGFGHFLISKHVHEVLASADYGTLSIDTGDDLGAIEVPMYVVSCMPLFTEDNDARLYVLTLGDRRYRLWNAYFNDQEFGGETFASAVATLMAPVSFGSYTTHPALPSSLDPWTLSSKWNRFAPFTPPNLILEALANMLGRRWVFFLEDYAPELSGWVQSHEDALWAEISPRLAAGGKLTADQIKRCLPSNYTFRGTGGSTYNRTMTQLLGSTSTGDGRTVGIQMDTGTVDPTKAQDIGSQWLKNHLSGIDATVHGCFPITPHAGLDYILVTHRATSANMRIVSWGKSWVPGFSFIESNGDAAHLITPGIAALRGFECDDAGNIVVNAVVDWFLAGSPITITGRVVKESDQSVGIAGLDVKVESLGYGSEPPVFSVTVTTNDNGDWTATVTLPPVDSDRTIRVTPQFSPVTPASIDVLAPFDLSETVANFRKTDV